MGTCQCVALRYHPYEWEILHKKLLYVEGRAGRNEGGGDRLDDCHSSFFAMNGKFMCRLQSECVCVCVCVGFLVYERAERFPPRVESMNGKGIEIDMMQMICIILPVLPTQLS